MCKSIYKKLAKDFDFVRDFGFSFSKNLKHYVFPSIVYQKPRYALEVGFNYEEDRFYVHLRDSTKIKPYNKETLRWIETLDPQKKALWGDGIEVPQDILKGIALEGSSYKDQVDQVKKILREYLDTNFQSMNL